MNERVNPLDLDKALGDKALVAERSPEEQDIRARLQAICEADPRRICDDEGNVLPISQWPDTEAAAIERYTYNEKSGHWTFKFFDKIKATDALSRLDGLYKQNEVTENPLVLLLERLPREQLRIIATELSELGRHAVESEVPADD